MEQKIKVWDAWIRVFHWFLVVLLGAEFLLADDFLAGHAYAGYVVIFLLAGRVVWGFVGAKHALFSDFLYPLKVVRGFVGDMVRLRHSRYLGHNPAAGVMIVIILAFVALTAVTGVAVYGIKEAAGPLAQLAPVAWKYGDVVEDVHKFFAGGTLALIVAHILAAVLESVHFRENLVVSMINGLKRKEIS